MTIFKCENEFPKHLGLKTQMKICGHFPSFHVSFLSFMVLKLSKIVPSDVSKNSKAVIAINVYATKSSRFAFLENAMGYYAMT